MRGPGQSEVSVCGNGSRPGCAARRSDLPVNAVSLSSRRKGSAHGARNIDIRKAERVEKKKNLTMKSMFSTSACRSNLSASWSRSHTRIWGLYVPVAMAWWPSRVLLMRMLASGNSKCCMSCMAPSTCSRMARFPLDLAARLRTSQSGRDEADPAAAPLTVYTLTIAYISVNLFQQIQFFITWCHVKTIREKSCIHKNDIQVVQ